MGAALTLAAGLLHARCTGRPYLLSHLLTSRCNLSCPYCIWKRNEPDCMTTEQVLALHRQAAASGFRGAFLWGGEPLLRADIIQILEHARSLGWFVSLATNGTLLPLRAKRVAPLVNSLLVSIDHPTEHDSLRGGEGVLDSCLRGLRLAKEANPALHRIICTVLTKHNWERMGDLAAIAEREGCLLLVQQMDRGLTETGERNDPHDVTQDQRDAALDELIRLKRLGKPVLNSYAYLHQFRTPAKQYACRCQRIYLTVNAKGQVWGCAQNRPVGDALRTPLKDILASAEYAAFREAADRCSRCRDAGTLENTFLYNLDIEPLWNLMAHSVRAH